MKERWEVWKRLPAFWWKVRSFSGYDSEQLASTCLKEMARAENGIKYNWELRGPFTCTQ